MKRRMVKGLMAHGPDAAGLTRDLLAKLPVLAQGSAKKLALAKELRDIDRRMAALERRSRRAASALERLPILNTLIEV